MTSAAFLPVHTLAAEVAARRLSPVDLADECLARIERLEPRLRAFVSVNATNARLAAEAADKAIRAGHPVGPLHGIPIAIKDLVEIEGEVAMGGSAAWRNRRAPHTATLVHRLMAAGMINLGKTHTVEFAYGGWGTNQHLGTPWNPWDATTHRTPGGSSSGSGVAVAARMAPCAIGTDTGGSVRIPAAWNGITGLKTSIGRISTFGVLPLSPTLDTPGPITRDIEDAALLLAVLQGEDRRDWHTLGVRDVDPMVDHRQTVLGRQPIEQAAYGAFLISVGSRVDHRQVRAPRSCDHDRRRECGRRSGGELQGQQNFPDRHHFHSGSNTVCRRQSQGGMDQPRMENPRVGRFHQTRRRLHRTSSNRFRHCEATSTRRHRASRSEVEPDRRYQLGDGLIVKIESVSNAGARCLPDQD